MSSLDKTIDGVFEGLDGLREGVVEKAKEIIESLRRPYKLHHLALILHNRREEIIKRMRDYGIEGTIPGIYKIPIKSTSRGCLMLDEIMDLSKNILLNKRLPRRAHQYHLSHMNSCKNCRSYLMIGIHTSSLNGIYE